MDFEVVVEFGDLKHIHGFLVNLAELQSAAELVHFAPQRDEFAKGGTREVFDSREIEHHAGRCATLNEIDQLGTELLDRAVFENLGIAKLHDDRPVALIHANALL
jgi:hypothetical protein